MCVIRRLEHVMQAVNKDIQETSVIKVSNKALEKQ